MSIFNHRRKDPRDPFGDWDWDSPFGFSLLGREFSFPRGFHDLDRVFELAEKGELPAVGEGGPYIYASSTYVGPDGIPHHREVKNFEGELPGGSLLTGMDWRYPQSQALTEGAQRPHYELQTHEKELSVTIELPGLTKKDLELETSATELHLKGQAEGTQRNYVLDLDLPQAVLPGKAKASFKNGILDLTLPLAKPGESSKRIRID